MYSAAHIDIVTTPALSVDLCESLSWLCNIIFSPPSCKSGRTCTRERRRESSGRSSRNRRRRRGGGGGESRGIAAFIRIYFFLLLHGARAIQTGPSWVWYCHGEFGYPRSSSSTILLHPPKKHRGLRRRPHRLLILLLPAPCRVMVGLPCWMLPALSGSSTTEPPLTADPHFRRKPSQSYRATYGNWGSKF